jgi:phosphoketolase
MSMQTDAARALRVQEYVDAYRRSDPRAERWVATSGPIEHTPETQARVFQMAQKLQAMGVRGDGPDVFEVLHAADRITAAGMWLVVHETYAKNVYLDGRELKTEDFKDEPEGHTGGALNMVPAYTGYMAANAISAETRAWVMGQGHVVAAIDSVNLLLDNMTKDHADRYSVTDEGLTRYVRDFYSYAIGDDGKQDSPLGSHVNAHTAGGLVEGGYLGFTELLYAHMPLPGEKLVVFLSDGAFEEQRGSDWTPRWWRADDTGIITPIMIKNGRRIDQRTTMSQSGGADWFADHLRLNNFDPIEFDGRDPAAFAWAIFEMEWRLEAAGRAVAEHGDSYPVPLPHGMAVAPKGAGFYGAGTNLAHNLPLGTNPSKDPVGVQRFNESARKIWVDPDELSEARSTLQQHDISGRPRERDHALATRTIEHVEIPEPQYNDVPDGRADPASWRRSSPMRAVDGMFAATVRANPHLRPRVGNPDEMRSNRMIETLDQLHFRVTAPEPGVPESIDGAVITALNEEAVACAAFGNSAGINIIVTYEAFGTKMHGAARQEIIWANHSRELGRPPRWLSIPLVLTSHTWENAKNEQSHQDPSMAEAMLGEPSDVSRVLFAADHNSAAAIMCALFASRGQIWTLVVPKAGVVPDLLTPEEAGRLVADGALRLDWAGHDADGAPLVITAVGAYQLEHALLASRRLREHGVAHSVVCMAEPGRFRVPRNEREAEHNAPADVVERLYPASAERRVFVSHTRPEPLLGTLQPLHTGRGRTEALGFMNHGGTLSIAGLMYINRCTWAHVIAKCAEVMDADVSDLLSAEELDAISGRRSPHGVVID